LVDTHGVTYVVGTRGDVFAISRDGSERWHVSTEARQPGSATLLSDDTVVFVDSDGDVVAVREGATRWRARIEDRTGDNRDNPAPLPLVDGGVVVATTHELAAFDAEGHERGRSALSEGTAGPPLAALGKVVVVGLTGVVWGWTPGASEPSRLAGFGARTSDGAALADDHTLLAVAGQSRLLSLDLLHGEAAVRATAPPGTFIFGPPATLGSATYMLWFTPTIEEIVGVDERGAEVFRTMLASHPAAVSVDGGAGSLALPRHTAPLVDDNGTVAFATTAGAVGIATRSGAELLPFACPPSPAASHAPPVAGLAPLGQDAFVAVCSAGTLFAVHGRSRPAQPKERSSELGARPL
jgi:hypothetical protein